ncbi:hypothetical protein [Sinomonas sp.]
MILATCSVSGVVAGAGLVAILLPLSAVILARQERSTTDRVPE